MNLILVNEETLSMSEDEVRKAYPYGKVGIHYAFNNYSNSVEHILKLKEEVLKDYPEMSESDMAVWVLTKEQTIRHANFTTLFVDIPIDDYLKLRKENKIGIR